MARIYIPGAKNDAPIALWRLFNSFVGSHWALKKLSVWICVKCFLSEIILFLFFFLTCLVVKLSSVCTFFLICYLFIKSYPTSALYSSWEPGEPNQRNGHGPEYPESRAARPPPRLRQSRHAVRLRRQHVLNFRQVVNIKMDCLVIYMDRLLDWIVGNLTSLWTLISSVGWWVGWSIDLFVKIS